MIVIISISIILNILQNSRNGWIPGKKSLHQTTWIIQTLLKPKHNIKGNTPSLNHFINIKNKKKQTPIEKVADYKNYFLSFNQASKPMRLELGKLNEYI